MIYQIYTKLQRRMTHSTQLILDPFILQHANIVMTPAYTPFQSWSTTEAVI